MKNSILFILLSTFAFASFSQNGFDWGASKKAAEPKYLNLSVNYNSPNYKATMPRIQWLVKNAPNLNRNLYIWGAEVYKKAEKEETDLVKKAVYQDSVLFMYDQYMSRFNEPAIGTNYKGLVAYKYLSKRENTTDTLFNLYNRAIAINDTNTFKSNVYYYLILNLVKYSAKQVTEDELLKVYQNVNRIYDHQIATSQKEGKSVSTLTKYKDKSKTTFSKYYTLTCESIEKLYKDELNKESASEIKSMLEAQKCTSSSMYLKALTLLKENNPSEENRLALADYNYSNGKKTDAIKEYEALLKSSSNKGPIAYKLFETYKSSNRTLAVSYAKKCISLGYKKAETGLYIGNKYYNSLEECRTKDVVKTRAIYLAAYKYYEIAGNTSKMSVAKGQFPSQEEVFLGSRKVGETISTGCWVNETVVIKVR